MLYTEHLYGWDDSSVRMLIQFVSLTETANKGTTCQLAPITLAFPLRIIAYQLGISFIHWHYKFNFSFWSKL